MMDGRLLFLSVFTTIVFMALLGCAAWTIPIGVATTVLINLCALALSEISDAIAHRRAENKRKLEQGIDAMARDIFHPSEERIAEMEAEKSARKDVADPEWWAREGLLNTARLLGYVPTGEPAPLPPEQPAEDARRREKTMRRIRQSAGSVDAEVARALRAKRPAVREIIENGHPAVSGIGWNIDESLYCVVHAVPMDIECDDDGSVETIFVTLPVFGCRACSMVARS